MPPSAFPFHELPNCVLSPHRGGAAGISESELFDEDGRIGRGIQALYIAPR